MSFFLFERKKEYVLFLCKTRKEPKEICKRSAWPKHRFFIFVQSAPRSDSSWTSLWNPPPASATGHHGGTTAERESTSKIYAWRRFSAVRQALFSLSASTSKIYPFCPHELRVLGRKQRHNRVLWGGVCPASLRAFWCDIKFAQNKAGYKTVCTLDSR